MIIFYHKGGAVTLFLFDFWFVYSFFGCIIETAFSLITAGKLMIRKTTRFLPFCPVYGIGAVVLYYALTPFYSHPLIVALLGIIIGSTVEYLYGHLTLALFNVRVWDYTLEKHHCKRLISLRFSFFWAILSLIFIYYLAPITIPLIYDFPEWLSLIMLFMTVFDTVLTVKMLNSIKNGADPNDFQCPVLKCR